MKVSPVETGFFVSARGYLTVCANLQGYVLNIRSRIGVIYERAPSDILYKRAEEGAFHVI